MTAFADSTRRLFRLALPVVLGSIAIATCVRLGVPLLREEWDMRALASMDANVSERALTSLAARRSERLVEYLRDYFRDPNVLPCWREGRTDCGSLNPENVVHLMLRTWPGGFLPWLRGLVDSDDARDFILSTAGEYVDLSEGDDRRSFNEVAVVLLTYLEGAPPVDRANILGALRFLCPESFGVIGRAILERRVSDSIRADLIRSMLLDILDFESEGGCSGGEELLHEIVAAGDSNAAADALWVLAVFDRLTVAETEHMVRVLRGADAELRVRVLWQIRSVNAEALLQILDDPGLDALGDAAETSLRASDDYEHEFTDVNEADSWSGPVLLREILIRAVLTQLEEASSTGLQIASRHSEPRVRDRARSLLERPIKNR